MNNIFVYCEIEGGKVADVSLELLTKGRALADTLGCELEALALGQGLAGVEKQLAEYGADVVHVADCECLAPYRTLPHAAVVCGIFKEEQPQIALFGATPVGRDLGPRVSSALHSGLTADCTSLEIGPHTENKTGKVYENLLYQIRPAFGGNIMAQIVTPNHRPQMATVRYKVMDAPTRSEAPSGEITERAVTPAMLESGVTVLGVTPKEPEQFIEGVDVLVAAGRGVKKEEDLALLEELAELLGGQLACTRPLAESGWVEAKRQVGLSGRTVRPRLIITCGVSGAVQFVAGMQGADLIVAINQDEKAPIFKTAHYGLVGDLYEIVPRLIERIKAAKGVLV